MSPIGVVGHDIRLTWEEGRRHLRVRCAACILGEGGVTPLRSQAWNCILPDPHQYIEEPIGTSETRGIVGGVQQPFLAAQSEAVERAVGDALTVAFAEFVHVEHDVKAVIFLGPPFPKIVGRLLSLHPPKTLNIVWVFPFGHDMSEYWRLLSPSAFYGTRIIPWSDEEILSNFTYPDEQPQCAIDFVDIGDRQGRAEEIRSLCAALVAPQHRLLRKLDVPMLLLPEPQSSKTNLLLTSGDHLHELVSQKAGDLLDVGAAQDRRGGRKFYPWCEDASERCTV